MNSGLCLTFILILVISGPVCVQARTVKLEILDKDSNPLPCRIHLTDEKGKSWFPDHLPNWKDHFVCDGNAELELPDGRYILEIERGPEYERWKREFKVDEKLSLPVQVQLNRIAHLNQEGWYSGDLHVHRPVEQIELLMKAEDLNVAPVITWWNERNLWKGRELPNRNLVRFDRNRFYDLMAGEDEREGGALLYFHLKKPLKITGSTREYPSPMKFLLEAREHPGAWVDIEKPFWWDVPIWLASGKVDSIGLANNHMCRSRMYEDEAWGKPRDSRTLPAPRGNGYWTQHIYYQILNIGLRIPPSAGSASGVLPNPVGYNRVYVHVENGLTWEKWWAGLKKGQSFVTNGPILLCKANGQLPGHVFQAQTEKKLEIRIDTSLISSDEVPVLEVIQNGKVTQSIPVNNQVKNQIQAKITFDKSGWFLVRVITSEQRTFRFASTAPWYVELGREKSRISRSSVQFFLDWCRERINRVKKNMAELDQREEVLIHHLNTQNFWRQQLEKANAE